MYKYILTANYLVFFVLFSSESPCCDHECYEVRVVFDLCRDSGVVVVPLVSCNSSASAFLAKCGKKFNKNVMRCDITTEDFRMLGACEDLLEFFGVYCVFTEEVELGERSVDHFLAGSVGQAANANQEFVVVHIAVLACVEVFKQETGFLFGDGATKVF